MQSGIVSRFWLIAIAGCLAACDLAVAPSTPLADALTAIRRADRGALLHAKEDAEAAMKGVPPIADDRCTFDLESFRRRSEVAAIERLNRDALFRLSEPERLLYALNVINAMPLVPPYDEETCPPLDAARQNVRAVTRSSYRDAAAKLGDAVNDWVGSYKADVGNKFEANMRDAAVHLTAIGLDSKWPPTPACVPYDGSCH